MGWPHTTKTKFLDHIQSILPCIIRSVTLIPTMSLYNSFNFVGFALHLAHFVQIHSPLQGEKNFNCHPLQAPQAKQAPPETWLPDMGP